MLTDKALTERITLAIASLKASIAYADAYGGPVVDGSMYSPSDRAVAHAESVWQHGTDKQWTEFKDALDEAYEELGIHWEDGMAWIASDDDESECQGHPAGPYDPMGETVYCDGSCRTHK
jgi:hypothetical protein